MLGRLSNGFREDGSVKTVMFLLVCNGRRSKQRRISSYGKDYQVNRIRLDPSLKDVRFWQIGRASTNARDDWWLCAKGDVVCRLVVRRRLSSSRGGNVGQYRFFGVVFRSFCSDRNLAPLVLRRDVIFRQLKRRNCFERFPSNYGDFVLTIRRFSNDERGFRLQVRDHRRVECRILGAIRRKGHAGRHRYNRYRSARKCAKGRVSNVI